MLYVDQTVTYLNEYIQSSNTIYFVLFANTVILIVMFTQSLILFGNTIPKISVELNKIHGERQNFNKHIQSSDKICSYDPASSEILGIIPVDTKEQVLDKVALARQSQKEWQKTSFSERKKMLRILIKYILENQDIICREAALESGKPMVDAAFGETLVTLEKLKWLIDKGEKYLKPEYRESGAVMFYKSARVEYEPLGVIGAIVPWNYPFHNIYNPVSSAIFAGNAIVVKPSELTSWSSLYYIRIIQQALKAVSMPPNLVQGVYGYGPTGEALVKSGVDKVIFVGSPSIGRLVMKSGVQNLTPVVLELGGKDPFIIFDDVSLNQVVPLAMRAAYQSCGQNCVAAERFIVQKGIYQSFITKVTSVLGNMRQGPPIDNLNRKGGVCGIDCGVMRLPSLPQKLDQMIKDATSKGAKAHYGGQTSSAQKEKGVSSDIQNGLVFPPTLLYDVTPDMLIWKEEAFGPIMTVTQFSTEQEAVQLANESRYALGSTVFSHDLKRANRVAHQIEAGMCTINDFSSNYMCQSLPFGGRKESGFDRFAGVEGLRGMCNVKAICQDAYPWLIRTDVPPALQYPVKEYAFEFVKGLQYLFYGLDLRARCKGIFVILQCLLTGSQTKLSLQRPE